MNFFDMASFKVRFSASKIAKQPKVLVAVATLVLVSGFLVSLFLNVDSAFQRSGALLVSYAIFCVFLNHFLSLDIQFTDKLGKTIIRNNPYEVLRDIKQLRPDISDEEANKHLENAMMDSLRLESERNLILEHKKTLATIEFSIGFIGTLVWGFGDLLF